MRPAERDMKCQTPSSHRGKAGPEHRKAALRFGLRGLVLQYVPMLGEDAVGNAHDLRSNPASWPAESRKAAVHDHEIVAGKNDAVLVPYGIGGAPDEVDQSIAAR